MSRQIVDYHFIDEQRIDEYFDQLAAPLKLEILRNWKLSFGWSGLSFTGEGTQHARPYTTQEKLDILFEYFKQSGAVKTARITDLRSSTLYDGSLNFFDETVVAQRCRIGVGTTVVERNVSLWIAPTDPNDQRSGNLILIEDRRPKLGPFNKTSAFSSLMQLASEMERTITDDLTRQDEKLDNWNLDFREAARRVSDHFVRDPISTLCSLGAVADLPRRVRILYHLRFAGADRDDTGDYKIVVFGYPLIISTVKKSEDAEGAFSNFFRATRRLLFKKQGRFFAS